MDPLAESSLRPPLRHTTDCNRSLGNHATWNLGNQNEDSSAGACAECKNTAAPKGGSGGCPQEPLINSACPPLIQTSIAIRLVANRHGWGLPTSHADAATPAVLTKETVEARRAKLFPTINGGCRFPTVYARPISNHWEPHQVVRWAILMRELPTLRGPRPQTADLVFIKVTHDYRGAAMNPIPVWDLFAGQSLRLAR